MTERTQTHRLQVVSDLHRFIEQQVLPGTGVAPADFWAGFDAIVHDLAPKNAALLGERDQFEIIPVDVAPNRGRWRWGPPDARHDPVVVLGR